MSTTTRTTGGVLYYQQPAFSPGGKYLFVPCESAVKVYSVKNGHLVSTIDGFGGGVTSVRVVDEDRLMVTSLSGEVVCLQLCDTISVTTRVHVVWRHQLSVPLHHATPISPDQVLVVSRVGPEGPDTAFCRAYPKDSQSHFYSVTVSSGAVRELLVLPGRAMVDYRDGLLFTADRQCAAVYSCNLDGDHGAVALLHQFKLRKSAMCMQLCVDTPTDSPDAYMAIGDTTGRIILWYYNNHTNNNNHNNNHMYTTLHWHSDAVRSMACLPSGYLLSGGRESVLVLWRVGDQFKRFLPKIGDTLEHIAVSADWSRVAVSTRANKIVFVEAASFRTDPDNVIVGMSGYGVGCRVLGDPLFSLPSPSSSSHAACVYKGANGTIQCHDIVKDKHIGQLQVVDYLLTDASGASATDSAHLPDIESYAVSGDTSDGDVWMATVEGRPGLRPHFGYLKLWHKQAQSAFAWHCHTIIHRPHRGPVSHVTIRRINGTGDWVCVTASRDDTWKVWRLERVYDEGKLEDVLVWRPFYADLTMSGPTAVAVSADGLVAVSVEHSTTILDLVPLLTGHTAHPPFIRKLKVKGMRRPVNKIHFAAQGRVLIAGTNYDLIKFDLSTSTGGSTGSTTATATTCMWSVQNNTAISVSEQGDRVACLAVHSGAHWLLEFRIDDLQVIGRRQLDGVGRAVLCRRDSTVCIHGDGLVTLFGPNSVTDTLPSDTTDTFEPLEKAKRQRLIKDALFTAPAPVLHVKQQEQQQQEGKRAPPVKSKAHLCSLQCTNELPSVRDIFAKFIRPRII